MKEKVRCPRCKTGKSWRVRRNKRRCAVCRYEWSAERLPLHLLSRQWHPIIRLFLRGYNSPDLIEETRFARTRVLRALLMLRTIMAKDILAPFRGVVEMDETYLRGQSKNKRLAVKRKEQDKQGGVTAKQPVFGILCRSGQV